jgi:hypothetical protein
VEPHVGWCALKSPTSRYGFGSWFMMFRILFLSIGLDGGMYILHIVSLLGLHIFTAIASSSVCSGTGSEW